MTDPKPTLEEQIDYQQRLLENYQVNPVVTLIAKSILASLKELQSIRSAEMPVEPVLIEQLRFDEQVETLENKVWRGIILKYIDALKLSIQKRDAELAALRGRLMEPVAYRYKYHAQTSADSYVWVFDQDTWNGQKPLDVQPVYAMSAVALKEGE